jgi:hypothetical protein
MTGTLEVILKVKERPDSMVRYQFNPKVRTAMEL